MLTYKQPVFFCGENPGLTLYSLDSHEVVAIASYWHCTYSIQGAGHALVLWLHPQVSPFDVPGLIFTDNMPLAQLLRDTLTQYFPEFENRNVADFPLWEAQCHHMSDGQNQYQAHCATPQFTITVEWRNWLGSSQLIWPGFPAGSQHFDLTNVICPCGAATLTINNQLVAGQVKSGERNGRPVSSAFLAFAETWVGPFSNSV